MITISNIVIFFLLKLVGLDTELKNCDAMKCSVISKLATKKITKVRGLGDQKVNDACKERIFVLLSREGGGVT